MNGGRIFLLSILLTAGAAVAFAQQAPPPPNSGGQKNDDPGIESQPAPRRGGELSEKKREEVMKKIETVRIWRLTEELNLDQGTAAKLSAFLGTFDQPRKTILREQVTIMRDLRRAVNTSKPDEAKLKAALERLEKNRYAIQELKEKEFNGLKDILTIEQQARFVLFQQNFQHEMRRMLEGARAGGQRRPGTGPGGRQDSPPENR
jgi:Spy/CpxP family protein refolding chaperone